MPRNEMIQVQVGLLASAKSLQDDLLVGRLVGHQ